MANPEYYSAKMREINLMEIVITTGCNMQCHYCFQGGHSCDKSMSLDVAKKICQEINKYKNITQISFIGGEPLRPETVEVLTYFAKNTTCHFTISSNGYEWNDDIFVWLYQNRERIDNIQISLDGNQKLHDRFRVKKQDIQREYKGTWYDVVQNLIKLRVMIGMDPKQISIRSTWVHGHYDEIYDSVYQMQDWYQKHWFGSWHVSFDTTYHREYHWETWAKIFQRLCDDVLVGTLHPIMFKSIFQLFDFSTNYKGKIRCTCLEDYLTINIEGDFIPCHFDPDTDIILGSIIHPYPTLLEQHCNEIRCGNADHDACGTCLFKTMCVKCKMSNFCNHNHYHEDPHSTNCMMRTLMGNVLLSKFGTMTFFNRLTKEELQEWKDRIEQDHETKEQVYQLYQIKRIHN